MCKYPKFNSKDRIDLTIVQLQQTTRLLQILFNSTVSSPCESFKPWEMKPIQHNWLENLNASRMACSPITTDTVFLSEHFLCLS